MGAILTVRRKLVETVHIAASRIDRETNLIKSVMLVPKSLSLFQISIPIYPLANNGAEPYMRKLSCELSCKLSEDCTVICVPFSSAGGSCG
jgi:hypothetical protein